MSSHGHESHGAHSDSTGTLGHAVKGGLALAATDYLSGGAVQNAAASVATNVNSAIAGGGIASATPYFTGPLAPFATGAWSLYNGVKKGWAERGVWGATERTALNYGIIGGGLTAAGIMTAPAVIPAAVTGLALYGTRHLYHVGKTLVSDPLGTV